jgi:hypothetical protein
MHYRGGNNFKIPHMNKRGLRAKGLLTTFMVCSQAAIDVCTAELAAATIE